MRANAFTSLLIKSALAAALLASAPASAQQQINLTAAPALPGAVMPDGSTVPMWGYTCGALVSGTSASCAALNPGAPWSPVVITVPSGQSLQINLTNQLVFTTSSGSNSVPTSIVIAGQLGGGLGSSATSTASPDHTNAQGQVTWPIVDPTTHGTPPTQGPRVLSFATEVAPLATQSLCWGDACPPGSPPQPALRPGTYLLTSGTHPSIQVPMGLYGILVVTTAPTTAPTAAPGTAYTTSGGTVNYAAEVPVLFSEIDPVQNAAVAQAVSTVGFSETTVWSGQPNGCGNPTSPTFGQCYPPAVNYTPLYYLVNGVAFDTTNPSKSIFSAAPGSTAAPVSGNVLVRLVNAGLRMHVPSIVGSQTTGTVDPSSAGTPTPGLALIAEDGNVLPGVPRVQSEVFLAAGKTYDVMVNVPAACATTPPASTCTALPIFDRQLSLSANSLGRDGGMLAYLSVNGGSTPFSATPPVAVANPDTYNAVIAGKTLTVSDPFKGVIANDVNVYGVQILTPATKGTVTLNADGTFSYAPATGWSSPDTFVYQANGNPSIHATVTLGAATLEAATGITLCNGPGSPCTFTSNAATSLSIKAPGVLTSAVDQAGYPLTVSGATGSSPAAFALTGPGTGSASVDATGGFNATVSMPGTYTFNVYAQNSQGTVSATSGTITLNFPTATGLAVTVLDGNDKTTQIADYRWIIEEDRTFYVDPNCTTNPLPAGCPAINAQGTPPVFGVNFHTSHMPLVATGCTGALSCEAGQTIAGSNVVCDVGNGVCRPGTSQTPVDPGTVYLDPTKRYYLSILPGDAANPFNAGYGGPPCGQPGADPTTCVTGHGMGGAPIAAGQTAVTILTQPSPYPPATLTVFVFEDDFPLNGEHDSGGGVDVLAVQEPGLGGFQITLFDDAGGTGDATGQPTYDMFNMPLSNSLAGTIDPVTGFDACPISPVITQNATQTGAAATPDQCAVDPTLKGCQKGITGMIVTCPRFESDGQTLSPLAGQAVVKNLYQGRYGVMASPNADRIARGEEWLQTNTLDGQKAHDSFMRIGEPAYFQEFGPAGYHVTIGFANPKIINDRRTNAAQTGMCDPAASGGGGLACNNEIKGTVTMARMSRSPDQRLYGSGTGDAFAFTQCYASLGDPDGADFAFTKCQIVTDANGNTQRAFDFTGIPAGNWKITLFDQWNDQIVDGISTPVGLGSVPCNASSTSTATVCDMGEVATHQWQANIYTRTFVDANGNGLSDKDASGNDSELGLVLAPTNIRFRDGSYSNFNNTDLNGYAGFNEVFPLFNWYVIETDTTRYKNTGVHVVHDAGGPTDGSSPLDSTGTPQPCATSTVNPCGTSAIANFFANTFDPNPLPNDLRNPGAVYCAGADCLGKSIASGSSASDLVTNCKAGPNGGVTCDPFSTGRIDPPYWFGTYGWQGFSGQNSFLEFGKKPFVPGETGGIHGHVVYASTRPFDDPQLLLQTSWEPLVPHVRINLYQEGTAADGLTPTLTLIDHTETTSFDDWVQGFRSDGKPNISCPGQTINDPFFYSLLNQPQYLDFYGSQHGGAAAKALPYNSQFKCYDGMHNWNQLQPAPYDGMYGFPSVTGFDPATGRPSGTNCTACVTNPDPNDPYRYGGNPTPQPFVAGTSTGTPMLPAGKYVVEVVVPPGYELVKEEDKNILIGDNFIAPATQQFAGLGNIFILPDQAQIGAAYNAANAQNPTRTLGRVSSLPSHEGDTGSVESYWPCVGAMRQVPDFISLFPQSGEVSPFAGAVRPLCDRKEITLTDQSSALAKFYIFTSTHAASHFTGVITDDFTAEFDPFSPQFGEKFAPANLPVSVKDWAGNEVSRIYADQFGTYNGLSYSTWEVNPPNPTGYGPTMMVVCMNDSGSGTVKPAWDPAAIASGTTSTSPDPLFQPGYSQFCYELPFMPGQTGYFDTPVTPTSAFSEGYNHPDCNYPDATPAIKKVTSSDIAGPWVSASGAGHTLNITALGDQQVENYGYTGPQATTAPFNQKKITRHFGFGAGPSTRNGNCAPGEPCVALVGSDGVSRPLTGVSWNDSLITGTVPSGVPTCAVQQQMQYGGPSNGQPARCGQLVIKAANGKSSIDTVTVTIGGKAPTVLAAGHTIQSAIDAAQPGDMIIVPAGVFNEMVLMWKPIRLQGVGAATAVIDANAHPAGRLLTPWRKQVNCLFGLTPDGRPSSDTSCSSGWIYPTVAGTVLPSMIVDRLPFEAVLGWDATLNGNLAEQLIEPSLMGAYEGAAITVLGKGIVFTPATALSDAFGATVGGAFPADSILLDGSNNQVHGCGPNSGSPLNRYPGNFYCNPSSIDGLGVRNSSQGGGGILVHAYAHNIQIANNRVQNNFGTLTGGITVGMGEHPDVNLGGAGATPTTFPPSCETSDVTNLALPFCFDMNVNVHHNAVMQNASMGDELFSSTPAGAGGVTICTGSDYYQFTNNWVCGNMSTGDGGGVVHLGFSKNGDIEHNKILFNQSTNPTITTNGGGLLVMGAPDVDPTNCGVTNDKDCIPNPATVTPSDGSGPGLRVNANLILGNAAESGSGAGVRLQHINGNDVLNFPDGASTSNTSATAGLCSRDLSSCRWNTVTMTNNIIVNNVAGWDGGGVSLLDALAVNIVNNTIASNDSTASAGVLFGSLFAPLASAPGTNCTQNNGASSCPQVAGLVSLQNSPILQANLAPFSSTAFSCPQEHGTTGTDSCRYYSVPLLYNDVIWDNRSFYVGVGGFGSAGQNQNQQKIVTLFNSFTTTPAASQTSTGQCPTGVAYWDLGVRGDTDQTHPAVFGGVTLTQIPNFSVLTPLPSGSYSGSNNTTGNPNFTSQYCNGSRVPPEACNGLLGSNLVTCLQNIGWKVPPGTNETNALPTPVFSLTASATVDEGNNWINMRWGPLSQENPVSHATLGNYAPANTGSAAVNLIPSSATVAYGLAPDLDFFGNARRTNNAVDAGAVEFAGAQQTATATVSPSTLAFGNQPVTGATILDDALTVTVTNTGNVALAGGTFTFGGGAPQPFARATGTQGGGGTCGATLAVGASCTFNVVFSPRSAGAFSRTLTIAYTGGVVFGSPVTLTGRGIPRGTGTLSFTSAINGTLSTVFGQRRLTFASRGATSVVTVRNTGTAPLTLTAESLTLNPTPGFTINSTTCPMGTTPLAINGTCTITVTAPNAARNGTMAVVNNGTTVNATLALVGP
jgi:hypothetical protein